MLLDPGSDRIDDMDFKIEPGDQPLQQLGIPLSSTTEAERGAFDDMRGMEQWNDDLFDEAFRLEA